MSGCRGLWRREGDLSPTARGAHAWQSQGGWVGTRKGRGDQKARCHQARPGCLVTTITPSPLVCLAPIFQRAGRVGEGQINTCVYFKRVIGGGGNADHNDSPQVNTTQGVRHKFTCGKRAIHRCQPTRAPWDRTVCLLEGAAGIRISSHRRWRLHGDRGPWQSQAGSSGHRSGSNSFSPACF